MIAIGMRVARQFCGSKLVPVFGVGFLAGATMIATIQPAFLTWGLSAPVLMSTAILVAAMAMVLPIVPAAIPLRYQLLALATSCFAQPAWLRYLARLIPALNDGLNTNWRIDAVVLLLVTCSIAIPVAIAMILVRQSLRADRRTGGVMLAGLVSGLEAQVFVIGPIWGIDHFAILMALGAIVYAACEFWANREFIRFPAEKQVAHRVTIWHLVVCTAAGSIWCSLCHLVGDMMPVSYYVLWLQFIGLLSGCTAALFFIRTGRNRNGDNRSTAIPIVVALMASGMLALSPNLVEWNLALNSSLSWVLFLMLARSCLVLVATIPAGWLIGQVLSACCSPVVEAVTDAEVPPEVVEHLSSNRPTSSPDRNGYSFSGIIVSASIGWILAETVLQRGFHVGQILVASSLLIGLGQLFFNWRLSRHEPAVLSGKWRSAGRWITATLLLLAAVATDRHQPDLAGKLLFSATITQAHLRGWKSENLEWLDDSRTIGAMYGENGRITACKQMGGRCQFRERGIPRGSLSLNPAITPQAPYEVVQTVLPLVLATSLDRVLILGAGSGAVLHTTLGFPVQEVVLVEGNQSWLELMKGPIREASKANPLADARVRCQRCPVPLAIRAGRDQFDVILSCPTSPLIAASQSEFTAEFYHDAALRLGEGGVFAQRFDAVDFGIWPIASAVKTMQTAFRNVSMVETGAGEIVLLGTQRESLLPKDIALRIQAPQVTRVLAQCGWDWSMLLNLPSYEDAILREIAEDCQAPLNSATNSLWSFSTIQEGMRWGQKLQETQAVLTKSRRNADQEPGFAGTKTTSYIAAKSRKSRWLEWLGDVDELPILLKRLEEVAAQQQLVHDAPDGYWWEYRKSLKQKLQGRTRSALQQVNAVREETKLHPVDQHRKDYFQALSDANDSSPPSLESIAAIEHQLEPYDPLLTLFGHMEVAQIYARATLDPVSELNHRLYAVYHAPGSDSSVRNVIAALELILDHPETLPDASDRFDQLNSLLQTLRQRWEKRAARPCISVAVAQQDVDRSIVTTEKVLAAMAGLVSQTGMPAADWEGRRKTLFRLLITSLGEHRYQLTVEQKRRDQKKKQLAEALK